jgi:hypothetical protein
MQSHNMPLFLRLSSALLYHGHLRFISSVQQHLVWKKDEEYQGGVFLLWVWRFAHAVAGYGSILSASLLQLVLQARIVLWGETLFVHLSLPCTDSICVYYSLCGMSPSFPWVLRDIN